MEPTLGTLAGTAEVRGQNGELKGTFTFQTNCTPEQAEQLARDISLNLEEPDNGNHSR